ncbi:uncharacterized protein LOC114871027 [Osmia bicornis bicornis]|uniref:uncharacterized protein LOC114871027 n=1 Tax=Osmia bicornis bicornis TaxID=1437191 RepID=UPI001EAF64CC|nr:uncharacterized protein LOC114871027 [Osmia bicornis bicornis]
MKLAECAHAWSVRFSGSHLVVAAAFVFSCCNVASFQAPILWRRRGDHGLAEKFLVRCIAHFEESELVHLSENLNRLECLQLVKAMYDLTPANIEDERSNYEVLYQGSNHLSTKSKECLAELEHWNNNFPTNTKPNGRSAMEMTLRWLGRPDLAKYVRENHRTVNYMDTENYDKADTLEFPGHRVSRRHAPKKDKHSSKTGKKKKKTKKRGHREHPQNSGKKDKGLQKAVAATAGHATAHRSRELNKTDNQSQNKNDYVEQHRSIFCSILCVLFFLILCLVAVYFLHRRNRLKARGTRFKYDNSVKKENKDTLTDRLEWNDETVCSCSDVEDGYSGKCMMCGGNYQTHHTKPRRNDSHDSMKDSKSMPVQKIRKKKKRERFSFLPRNFHDRKRGKDQEDRDRKKTLEKSLMKKREKVSSTCYGDYEQCLCCKCNLSYTERMLREKLEERRELHKLRAKKRKEEKRRKREMQKAERHANVCFKDVSK